MPPDAMPIRDFRQETGVTNGTLYQWRNRVFYDGIYAEYPCDTNIHTHIDASSN